MGCIAASTVVVRFCPQPEGAPEGVYNTYFGFTVEPQRWFVAKAVVRASLPQRLPPRRCRTFQFFIAWLAQLVQDPAHQAGHQYRAQRQGGRRQVEGRRMGRRSVRPQRHRRLGSRSASPGASTPTWRTNCFSMAEEAFWAGRQGRPRASSRTWPPACTCLMSARASIPYEGVRTTRAS